MTPPLDLMLAYALLGLAISIGWRFVIHRPLKDAAIVGIFWPLTFWFFVLVGFLWAVNAWARSITSVLPNRGSAGVNPEQEARQ